MGLQFRKDDQGDVGGLTEEVRCTMTFDSVYTTGGELLDVSRVPFRVKSRIDSIAFEAHPVYAFNYDRTNERSGQVVVYEATAAGLTEVANGTDLSALAIAVVIKGR